jgi:hypothetical protein
MLNQHFILLHQHRSSSLLITTSPPPIPLISGHSGRAKWAGPKHDAFDPARPRPGMKRYGSGRHEAWSRPCLGFTPSPSGQAQHGSTMAARWGPSVAMIDPLCKAQHGTTQVAREMAVMPCLGLRTGPTCQHNPACFLFVPCWARCWRPDSEQAYNPTPVLLPPTACGVCQHPRQVPFYLHQWSSP